MTYDMADMQDIYDKLKSKIIKLQKHYYVNNVSLVLDEEYDKLFNSLIEIELMFHSFIAPDSPTQTVGFNISNSRNLSVHTEKIYSLKNTYNESDVIKTFKLLPEDTLLYVDMKNDGVSLRLHYKKGILTDAILRGDGTSGISIINYVKHIGDIPKKISNIKTITISGELTVFKNSLHYINVWRNNNNKNNYTSSRHAVAGLVMGKNSPKSLLSICKFIPFNIVPPPTKSHADNMKLITSYGFSKIEKSMLITYENISEAFLFKNKTQLEMGTNNLLSDGIVIRVNDIICYNEMGHTVRYPNGAIAYKFSQNIYDGIIESINYSVGKTGKIHPIGSLKESIYINNSSIKNISLNSYAFVIFNKINKGTKLSITLAGGAVPSIVSIMQNSKLHVDVNKCPSCYGEVIMAGKHLFCKYKNRCKSVLFQRCLIVSKTKTFSEIVPSKYNLNTYIKNNKITSVEEYVISILNESNITLEDLSALKKSIIFILSIDGFNSNTYKKLNKINIYTLSDIVNYFTCVKNNTKLIIGMKSFMKLHFDITSRRDKLDKLVLKMNML